MASRVWVSADVARRDAIVALTPARPLSSADSARGQAKAATTEEALSLIETSRLYDTSCGAVDIALLASVLLTPGARLWTADRHLEALAVRLGVVFRASGH